MNKEDLLLNEDDRLDALGKMFKKRGYSWISSAPHSLREEYLTQQASLKTAKAIRDEFRTVYKHGDIKTFRLIFDNLDSIIKELEAKS
jgi:hypothetical protein